MRMTIKHEAQHGAWTTRSVIGMCLPLLFCKPDVVPVTEHTAVNKRVRGPAFMECIVQKRRKAWNQSFLPNKPISLNSTTILPVYQVQNLGVIFGSYQPPFPLPAHPAPISNPQLSPVSCTLKRYLKSGQFLPSPLAWTHGNDLPNWSPYFHSCTLQHISKNSHRDLFKA